MSHWFIKKIWNKITLPQFRYNFLSFLKEQQNQTHLANYQLLTSSQTKINSTNLSSINYSYLLNNNTTSSTQASLQEKLKDINSSDLLLNARRRVHLNEEVQKEFKTSLPREPKVFHFHPVHNQGAAISNFKSTPHLASSIILDNQNHNSIQVRFFIL